MPCQYYVYILTNKNRTVLYTGVTNHIIRRVHQHKTKATGGFTARYNVDRLVYFEVSSDVTVAIGREKQIKSGPRRKKIALIEELNPEWRDLYEDLLA